MAQAQVTFGIFPSSPSTEPVPGNVTKEVSGVKKLAVDNFMVYPQKSERYKKIAIVTGVLAISALVAAVVFAILFPPLSIPFLVGAGVAGAAFLALGITSVVYSVRAVREKHHLDEQKNRTETA